ncbi:MAG: DUF4276 family protein [Candidatus Thiodiazotropha sp. L084R]
MSKKIGIIAEDASDVAVIDSILEKYMASNKYSVKKFVGNGCGKLRNKCGTWANMLSVYGCDHIMLFHDLDRYNMAELRKTLTKKVSKDTHPNSIIVIPVEELEAWLLSDMKAIKKVFRLRKVPKKIHDCESVTSPKEHLRDLVWAAGKKRYLNTTHNKKIAQAASVTNFRRCKSYKEFDEYVKNMA